RDRCEPDHRPRGRVRPPLAPPKPYPVVPDRVHRRSPSPGLPPYAPRVAFCRRFCNRGGGWPSRLDNGGRISYMREVSLARRGCAVLAAGLTVVAVAAATPQPSVRGAKDYLASARRHQRAALAALGGSQSAAMRIRAARSDLAATLGAAELPVERTRSVQQLLLEAARANGRALSGSAASRRAAVRAALAKEARAAA